jgi:hypothetical protein
MSSGNRTITKHSTRDGSTSSSHKKSPSRSLASSELAYRRRVLGQDATNYVMKRKRQQFADEKARDKTLKRKFDKTKDEKNVNNGKQAKSSSSSSSQIEDDKDEEDPCCICLDSIKVRGKLDCCDHRYCFDCIKRWSKETNQCPQCKKRFNQLEKITGDNNDNTTNSPANNKKRRKNSSKKRSSSNIHKIKKKDISVNHGPANISGILARIFDHFQRRSHDRFGRPYDRSQELSFRGDDFPSVLLGNSRSSSLNPIDLVNDDDENDDDYIPHEVEDTPFSHDLSRIRTFFPNFIRGMSNGSINVNLGRHPVNDGRGVSTETAISLIDSDDEGGDEDSSVLLR